MISPRGNAAIHYLPLSESVAPDGSPIQDSPSKADGDLYKFGVIAERPTVAGLPLGLGLRDIGGVAGLMDQRRRSPAKQDGLGGVVSMLTGEEGIYAADEFRENENRRANPVQPVRRKIALRPRHCHSADRAVAPESPTLRLDSRGGQCPA